MKVHTSIFTAFSISGICIVLTACSTTGDPNSGGIFWSPSKAMERRQALLQEQSSRTTTLSHLESDTAKRARERNRLLQKRAELRAKKAMAHPVDEDVINSALNDIELELERM